MSLRFSSAVLVALMVSGSIALSLPGRSSVAVAQSQVDPRKAEGDRLLQQGIQQHQTSQFEAALQSWQQALLLYRKIKNRFGEGQTLNALGVVSNSLGNYAKAIEYHQQSLAIAQEIKDRRGEGAALINLGLAYFSLGNYAKAIEYQQQSLAIVREIEDRQDEGNALGNLGLAYFSLGNYAKAIEYQQQSLAIAREIRDRQGEGQALGNLGIAYYSLGNYAKAIEYHQQYLAIAREIKDRQGEGQALGNLGAAYGSLGNHAKAIEYQQQHLAIAREIRDRLGEGNALGNLGIAYYSLGSYAKAIEYQQQRLAIAREIKDRRGEGQSLNNLGVALLKSNNLVDAEKILLEGIQVWESLRAQLGNKDTNKVSVFEEQARTYRILQRVLIASNKPTAALEISERGRARALVEQLTRRLKGTGTGDQLTVQPATLAQIQQIAKSHNATLVQYSIIYDEFKIQGKQVTQESDLYIWVIKPSGEVSFRKADLKTLWQQQNTSLEALVDQTRQALGVGNGSTGFPGSARIDPTTQTNRLKQLHQLLIDPIASLLPTDPNDRVIFMPQGPLFLTPFTALQDANGKYLIEEHTILTAPSIQVLDLTRTQRLAANSRALASTALVVGNPTMPKVTLRIGDSPQQLNPLPGAEQEAIAIAPLLQTKALIGNQGRKAAIVQQMPSARIIHFATHGLLDDFQGLGVPGAIALAPDGTGKDNDGLLTANDILDLKLTADLVVLSACDTGRGKITGDSVIGLSRSFFSAGVPSLIVSLWSVPDAPTAQLMTEFYTNWRDRKLDKAQALRQAMLTTLKTHPNPRDWAAFTLIGEAE